MLHPVLAWLDCQDPMTLLLIVLVALDIWVHILGYAKKKLAPRRCRLGFHTCAHCAMVLAVHDRRNPVQCAEGREVDPKDLPPGLRGSEENHVPIG